MRRNLLYQTFIHASGMNLDLRLYDQARDAAKPKAEASAEAAPNNAEPRQKYLEYLKTKPKMLEGGKKQVSSDALVVYHPHRGSRKR